MQDPEGHSRVPTSLHALSSLHNSIHTPVFEPCHFCLAAQAVAILLVFLLFLSVKKCEVPSLRASETPLVVGLYEYKQFLPL